MSSDRGRRASKEPEPGPHRERAIRRKARRGARLAKGTSEEAPPRRNHRVEPKKKLERVDEEGGVAAERISLRERYESVRQASRVLALRARKPMYVLGRLFFAAALCAGAFAAYRLVDQHIRTSPSFAVASIELEGNQRLSTDMILESAGLALGRNIFAIPPKRASEAILRHPWIAEAEVRRQLPSTLTIRVREHEPVAILSIERLYLVAEDGAVFKELEVGDPVDLPVINGVDKQRFVQDRAYRTAILLEVIALMHDYRGAGLWRREPIAEVVVEDDDGISLFVGKEPTLVRLGHPPHRTKLRRLRAILDRVEERDGRPEYVYLDNERRPDRVTARLREPRGG